MTTKTFWETIPKPIVGLSPMDGYSDSAFRRTCKAINEDIVTVTEFTSADGIAAGAERLRKKLSFHPSERPVLAQIFGKHPDTFIKASQLCEDMGFTGIDLNMGCPSKKVVRSEHGVALRRDPDHAFRLIESVATHTNLPVSVKTRLGWRNADDLASFAKGAENAGANMICIHARTYTEPYNVPAQWEPVYDLKRHVRIPVIGNGGITSYNDGMKKCGNLDGFYIGQASFGNPWVFHPNGAPELFDEKLPLILQHAQWLIEDKGMLTGTREIRKHLLSYVKGFKGARAYRSKIVHVSNLDDIQSVLTEICDAASPMISRSYAC